LKKASQRHQPERRRPSHRVADMEAHYEFAQTGHTCRGGVDHPPQSERTARDQGIEPSGSSGSSQHDRPVVCSGLAAHPPHPPEAARHALDVAGRLLTVYLK
jgi:hypothetical protein